LPLVLGLIVLVSVGLSRIPHAIDTWKLAHPCWGTWSHIDGCPVNAFLAQPLSSMTVGQAVGVLLVGCGGVYLLVSFCRFVDRIRAEMRAERQRIEQIEREGRAAEA